MTEKTWQIVAEINGVLEARPLIGRLEAEGIPVQMEEIGPNSAFPMTVGRLGMVRLYVPEAFVEQALSIVAYDYSAELDDEDFDFGEALEDYED